MNNRPENLGHFEKFHPWIFSNRQAKNAIFASLHSRVVFGE